jgi:hypothetical protein
VRPNPEPEIGFGLSDSPCRPRLGAALDRLAKAGSCGCCWLVGGGGARGAGRGERVARDGRHPRLPKSGGGGPLGPRKLTEAGQRWDRKIGGVGGEWPFKRRASRLPRAPIINETLAPCDLWVGVGGGARIARDESPEQSASAIITSCLWQLFASRIFLPSIIPGSARERCSGCAGRTIKIARAVLIGMIERFEVYFPMQSHAPATPAKIY